MTAASSLPSHPQEPVRVRHAVDPLHVHPVGDARHSDDNGYL